MSDLKKDIDLRPGSFMEPESAQHAREAAAFYEGGLMPLPTSEYLSPGAYHLIESIPNKETTMQYVFERTELEGILRLAYRHGFREGLLTEPAEKEELRQKQVSTAPGFKFALILAGNQPDE